jgi:hypothetical protein
LFGYEGMMFGFYLEAEFFQFGCSRHGCGGYVDGVRGVGMVAAVQITLAYYSVCRPNIVLKIW